MDQDHSYLFPIVIQTIRLKLLPLWCQTYNWHPFTRGIVVGCVYLPRCECARERARVCERQPWVCRRHGSSAIQARITKFGPEMQNTLVKILIVLGAINLDLQCRIQLKSSNWPLFDLVHTITHHIFMPGSLNLDLRCKTPWYKISIVLCHRLNPLHVYLSR